jgi:hypothetical protein
MPVQIPAASRLALSRSLLRYESAIGRDIVQQALDRVVAGLDSILNPQQEDRGGEFTVTVGDTPATIRRDVAELLKRFDEPEKIAAEINLDFKLQVATEVSQGAARHVADNYDQDELDAFPALELLRVYDRDVPRGEEPQGVRADNDWPSRWTFAARESGDTDALRMLAQHGRMIALKASPIWQSLGNGAGGYTDTLGNPFPPFAFNSGMDVDGVPRAECEALGLIQPGQRVTRAEIDFDRLFKLEEAA